MVLTRMIGCVVSFFLMACLGCANYGSIANSPSLGKNRLAGYSMIGAQNPEAFDDITLMLAFSGGGTRAAALSYGVLSALRDTFVAIDGRSARLLDEVDLISSVSGGSFTAAYFGLFGDRIFDEFEDVFLRRNITGRLISRLFNPGMWFSHQGRTEMAVKYYEKTVFNGAIFSDLQRAGGPLICINASDLEQGVRFSFLQEYFDLLCSDLSAFPVARAVTASSAVPLAFNPVVLENFGDCQSEFQTLLDAAQDRAADSPTLSLLVDGLDSYARKDRRYIHLVDGGVTDNLGLLAIYDLIRLAGGPSRMLSHRGYPAPRRFIIISVDAATNRNYAIGTTNKRPSIEQTVSAISASQLHRTNAVTLELLKSSVKQWTQEVSTPAAPAETYFVQIDFKQIEDPEKRQFVNRIPTNFALEAKQVDTLLEVGHDLLTVHPEFQRFLADLIHDDPAATSSGVDPQ